MFNTVKTIARSYANHHLLYTIVLQKNEGNGAVIETKATQEKYMIQILAFYILMLLLMITCAFTLQEGCLKFVTYNLIFIIPPLVSSSAKKSYQHNNQLKITVCDHPSASSTKAAIGLTKNQIKLIETVMVISIVFELVVLAELRSPQRIYWISKFIMILIVCITSDGIINESETTAVSSAGASTGIRDSEKEASLIVTTDNINTFGTDGQMSINFDRNGKKPTNKETNETRTHRENGDYRSGKLTRNSHDVDSAVKLAVTQTPKLINSNIDQVIFTDDQSLPGFDNSVLQSNEHTIPLVSNDDNLRKAKKLQDQKTSDIQSKRSAKQPTNEALQTRYLQDIIVFNPSQNVKTKSTRCTCWQIVETDSHTLKSKNPSHQRTLVVNRRNRVISH
ncbi:hypothetical protein GJ496_004334 [Pomphorhynchus laevis]|nr:hypothetical protein GJ496_004334 [Pomphorhynchus laevis]